MSDDVRPMLVFFWSERSGPARRMESLLAHLARKERNRLRVRQVDVRREPRAREALQGRRRADARAGQGQAGGRPDRGPHERASDRGDARAAPRRRARRRVGNPPGGYLRRDRRRPGFSAAYPTTTEGWRLVCRKLALRGLILGTVIARPGLRFVRHCRRRHAELQCGSDDRLRGEPRHLDRRHRRVQREAVATTATRSSTSSATPGSRAPSCRRTSTSASGRSTAASRTSSAATGPIPRPAHRLARARTRARSRVRSTRPT